MRILVFGGTVFVSKAVAAEAVRRGHEVVCAARGKSGAVPDGATLVRMDRDDPDGLDALAGQAFDAVVDTSIMSHRWTADALAALAGSAGHWTFVSSISVYTDHETPGQRPGAPVLDPRPVHATLDGRTVDRDLYGAVKVASENAVLDAAGDRAFIVRPGLVVGPGDATDRFGYWPARFARGGRVVTPEAPDQPIQFVDVMDLAAWIVDAGQQRLTGTFDAIGPPAPLPPVLREIAAAVGGDVELVPVPPQTLQQADVQPWWGERSLPLWTPEDHHGLTSHDHRPAGEQGLRTRPLADTVADTLEYEVQLGLDRERRAGLPPAVEAEVLALLS